MELQFNKGLIPAIAQDAKTGAVLMLAYMNEEAYKKTLETGRATYFSRSRQALWVKGETSGHTQRVVAVAYDCDADAILLKVEQVGPACHTGEYTCFHNVVTGRPTSGAAALYDDYATILRRMECPQDGSYTNYLLEKGLDKIAKKVGEEATEVIIAAKNGSKQELVNESADLLYHWLVLLAQQGVTPDDVFSEVAARQ